MTTTHPPSPSAAIYRRSKIEDSKSAEANVNELTSLQQQVITIPLDEGLSAFVHGPAGSGKTTALERRLSAMLEAGVPSYSVLTLVHELDAVTGYHDALKTADLGPYSDLHVITLAGLARRVVALFWPLIARPAGFETPGSPPVFLNYHLAQVHMKRVIEPLKAKGYFEGLRLRPQQVLSQLLDNLNRAAMAGLTLDEMEARLVGAWAGDQDHIRFLHQAADAVKLFRRRCLETNLLDFSLVIELFRDHLFDHPTFQKYFTERYHHLIVDNLEEMSPVGIDFLDLMLDRRGSTVLAFDDEGGYKRYLSADPDGARALHRRCDRTIHMRQSLTMGAAMRGLSNLARNKLVGHSGLRYTGAADGVAGVIKPRYRREMIHRVADTIVGSLFPARVAVIAPYLDGALLHVLATDLTAAGVPYKTLQRRGGLRDEPLVRGWLTLAALAFPHWGIVPFKYDVEEALVLASHSVQAPLDRPRAALVTRLLYDPSGPRLRPVNVMAEEDIARVGSLAVERIDWLGSWLAQWSGGESLDHFLGHLFTDLIGQRESGVRNGHAAVSRQAAVCARLIQMAKRFRLAAPALGLTVPAEQGKVFIESVYDGIVSGDPFPDRDTLPANAVIIGTVYAYLLNGRAVDYQVWLDVAASGWWQTPRQPLSNAFVLMPGWEKGRQWTQVDDHAIRNELLARLVSGLCARCGRGVVLASSDVDRRGQRQDGPLWRALSAVL